MKKYIKSFFYDGVAILLSFAFSVSAAANCTNNNIQIKILQTLKGTSNVGSEVQMYLFEFPPMPVIGTTPVGQDYLLGGFSSLHFNCMDGLTLKFESVPDLGTGINADVNGDGKDDRVFIGDYQHRVVDVNLDLASGTISLGDSLMFTRDDNGTKVPVTALPNLPPQSAMWPNNPVFGYAFAEETPYIFGEVNGATSLVVGLADPYGLDIESLTKLPDGTRWMVDERGPSVSVFDINGHMTHRYVPVGSNAFGEVLGEEIIPRVYGNESHNRGFEGGTMCGGNFYAFVQSPLDNPDIGNDSNSKNSLNGRVVVIDPVNEVVTHEYLYRFDGRTKGGSGGAVNSDKIGDAVCHDGKVWVIERNAVLGTDPRAIKNIYKLDFKDATDLMLLDPSIVGNGGTLEKMTLADLAAYGIIPIEKKLKADLVALGYPAEKAEGLAVVSENIFAIINDDDFQRGGIDKNTLLFSDNPTTTYIAIIVIP